MYWKYFAARRRTVILHNAVRTVDENGDNAWKREHSVAYKMETANGRPPLSLEQEVVGIIGYGLIGMFDPEHLTRLRARVNFDGRPGYRKAM
jgi:hypothetical protein